MLRSFALKFKRLPLSLVVLGLAGVLAGVPLAAQEQEKGLSDHELDRRLAAAAEGRWDDLHLVCECRGEFEWRSVELFGNGVGIWAQKQQFRVPRDQLKEILLLIRDAGFAEMPSVLGGTAQPQPPHFAKRVICRLRLELDGVSKEVSQLAKGWQSAAFRGLADRLFERLQEQGRQGLSVRSLKEGLQQLAKGELAPEVFRMLVNRRPGDSAIQAGEVGWLLRIQNGKVSVAPYLGAEGYGPERVSRLEAADVRELATQLIERSVTEWPMNLYAEHYTDLLFEVLDQERRLQARRFSGMTPQTHGQFQVQFDQIMQKLERLMRKYR